MIDPTKKFIGLSDRVILSKIQNREQDFVNGRITLNELRTELSEFHKVAVDPDVKKLILLEYDGLELSPRQVT